MNLVIDVGNTLAKAAVVDGGAVVASYSAERVEELPLSDIAEKYRVERSIISSTRGAAEQWVEYVRSIVGHCLPLDSELPVPLRFEYDRAKLGCDRLAAAVGAYSLYGGRELMIVDFGTAITIDFVSADGVFLGGSISPGVRSRFRSLCDYTATLPMCDPSQWVDGVATTTCEAIANGVMNGIKYEIEGYIREKNIKICEIFVIFSGGDSIFFDKRIKNTIFADREILFKGLSTILDYNA